MSLPPPPDPSNSPVPGPAPLLSTAAGPTHGDGRLVWRCDPFDTLNLQQLDQIFRARQQVFIVEQQCAFLDADGCDAHALHLTAWSDGAADEPSAYARILPPGIKYAEPSIGRVLTARTARSTGLGQALMRRAIDSCRRAHPGWTIRISAQARLQSFYDRLGFAAVGPPYDEDGIPHLEMLLPPV